MLSMDRYRGKNRFGKCDFHPAKFNIFYFHMLNLVVIEFRIGWKSNDDGLRSRIGNPKYLLRSEVQEISKIEHI